MSKETPASICQWAVETFGEAGSDARVVARANEEMAELLIAGITQQQPHKVYGEAADVAIVLCRVSQRAGGNLLDDARGISEPNMAYSPIEGWLAAQANAEMAKLLRIVTGKYDVFLIRAACANIYVALRALLATNGRQLWREVESKMAINRKRVWKKDGSGHGYHVREKEAAGGAP
jgi:hypothetical protein